MKSNLVVNGVAPVVSLVKGLSFVLSGIADIDSLARVSTGLLDHCVNVGILDYE